MKQYQVKVNSPAEYDRVCEILLNKGYEVDFPLDEYRDKIKWIIAHKNMTVGGNWSRPFYSNEFPVISYEEFIEQNKFPKLLEVGWTGKIPESADFTPINYKENNEMKKGNFIIGSIHKTVGTFSTVADPRPHLNFLSASQEAERLAREFTEKKFVVLEVRGIVSTNTVNWE